MCKLLACISPFDATSECSAEETKFSITEFDADDPELNLSDCSEEALIDNNAIGSKLIEKCLFSQSLIETDLFKYSYLRIADDIDVESWEKGKRSILYFFFFYLLIHYVHFLLSDV